jgi:spermidine/putrescine transport system ATP-binding protein
MSDRVVILQEGVIEQMGTPREIYERPRNVFVASFVGETNLLEGKVLAIQDQQTLQVELEGFITDVTTDQSFQVGDAIKVLLRPEDLRIETFQPTNSLNGCIEEKIYKGATLDSHVVLPNGKRVIVSEFFDEEHETLDHQIGEQVTMTWVKSWEVVLPNNGKK